MKHACRPTYFYCNTKGHTLKSFYIRNHGIPYSEYVWVRKENNPRGSNKYWVPRKYY